MEILNILPRLEFLDPMGQLVFRLYLVIYALAYWMRGKLLKGELSPREKLECKIAPKIITRMAINGSIKAPAIILRLFNNAVLFIFISNISDIATNILKHTIR